MSIWQCSCSGNDCTADAECVINTAEDSYLQVGWHGRPVLAGVPAAGLRCGVELVVHKLAVVHVAASVEVRAVAQADVSPGKQEPPEVQPPAGEWGVVRSACAW